MISNEEKWSMATATLDLTDSKQAHIDERLRTDLIAWFTSVRPNGRPHVVPVWFLWDGATVLVFSMPNQKVRNLRAQPAVMLALDDSHGGEDVILIEGQSELLPAGATSPIGEEYARKYAGKFAAMHWSPEAMAKSYSQAIRITPTRFL
jgi:PPOX class probable F420-dependent enzyme